MMSCNNMAQAAIQELARSTRVQPRGTHIPDICLVIVLLLPGAAGVIGLQCTNKTKSVVTLRHVPRLPPCI